jgi:hypothetical protein
MIRGKIVQKNHLLEKAFAVSVVLSFLCVAAASSINLTVAKATNDNNFIEVTTQAYGIKNVGSTTVKLTREQYQNLKQYLVEFRAQLNKTTTRAEVVHTFIEAVVELDTYGLLPKGMTTESAQQLVTGLYQKKTLRIQQGISLQNHGSFQEDDTNYLCLIAGQTNRTLFENIGSTLFNTIQFSTSNSLLSALSGFMYKFLTVRCSNNPFALMNRMNLGYHSNVSNVTYFASGWVSTTGTQGIKRNEGNIKGTLPVEGTHYSPGISSTFTQYPAVVGFIGIKIGSGTLYPDLQEGKEFFYVGTALWTSITS